MKMLKSIYFHRLSKEAYLLFFQSVVALIRAAGPDFKSALGPLVGQLEDLVAAMEAILRWPGFKVLTGKIAEADRFRDHALSELAAKVRSFVRFGCTPAMLESARRVEAVLEHFRKAARKSYDTETGAIGGILENLNGPYAADVAALGIGSLRDALQAALDNFIALIKEREDLGNQKPKETLRAVQKLAEAVYHKIVPIINAGALLNLSQEFAAFIAKINPEIERLNREFDKGRTSLKNAQVAPIPVQARTGRPITPPVQVFIETKDGTKELERDKDYYVTFTNNVEAGNAKCTVHGKGKYKGSQTITFAIARV